jgi:23S rRNA (pseudouridine1915-N3)-methyltransferase
MNGALLCVGRLKEKYWVDASGEYEKRLSRYGKFEVIQVDDLPEPRNASDTDRQKIMEKEGEALLRHISPRDHVVALCINAKQQTSEGLADKLDALSHSGKRVVFVIGGSLGLSPAVINRADEKLSMSQMTFPHQLARVMLLEQIYRACKIQSGEKYHK